MKIWKSPAGELNLERHPFQGEYSHQAWDSADSWILSRFPEQAGRIMITGEAFGVLGTAWGRGELTVFSDSLLSIRALEHNRGLNPGRCQGRLKMITPAGISADTPAVAEDPEGAPERIFIRIPKSLALLEFYLNASLGFASAETEIWLGAMDSRWSPGVKKITDTHLEADEVFPFESHARWIKFRKKPPQSGAGQAAGISSPATAETWQLGAYPLTMKTAPAVFSGTSLDAGTACFLWHFPEEAIRGAQRVADAGCGSGIFGLCAAYLNPEAEITFADESYLAVRSAEANYKLNNLSGKASFLTANGLEGIADSSVDVVLCNPPFHYANIQSREPAAFLFSEAARVLRPGGILQIVGNSHLGYHKLLKKYFTRVEEAGRDDKFTVLKAAARVG